MNCAVVGVNVLFVTDLEEQIFVEANVIDEPELFPSAKTCPRLVMF
jgi:hypothetical protein